VYQTLNYLNEAGVGSDLVTMANDTENKFDVAQSDETRYDPNTKTILFNPTKGIVHEDGSTSSPALGFLHEGDHAFQHTYHPEEFANDNIPYPKNSPEFKKWEAPIEKNTIEKKENPAAEQLNQYYNTKEAIRISHGSQGAYKTKGPTTQEPKDEASKKKRDKLIQKGKGQ
jgi:arabinogalactan endo-1,4-beta-galactosidase